MDPTLYWFMLPVAVVVATIAMLTGIAGSALFTPIFLVAFPLMGAAYVLPNAATAIGASLLTATFGFLSGFIGYARRGLIDYGVIPPFAAVGVPFAVAGAVVAHMLPSDFLRGAYAALMVVLAIIMLRHREPVAREIEAFVDPGDERRMRPFHRIIARNGAVYEYRAPRQGRGAYATALGGFLTGLLSTGIGEVVMPQLLRANRVPFPVAAATSVMIAILVVGSAAIAQVAMLMASGGTAAVPWHLVGYTIPGVLIGGQLGPFLQGRFPQKTMEQIMGFLFVAIAFAMMWIVVR
jgi:uncharacterized membrane protein YfcA